jgi:aminocarboxymuconate-semialdehyde decarboxylase
VRVDAHGHMLPDAVFENLPAGLEARRKDGGDPTLAAIGVRALDRPVTETLRLLDVHRGMQHSHGVDVSIIGPWVDAVMIPLDTPLQRAWCAVINDAFSTTFAGQNHSRFLAALPDLDGAAAADELERAASIGAVGGMLTSAGELGTLARHDFDALWDRAERLGLPIVLHPGTVEMSSRLQQHRLNISVGNPFETTLAAASLIAARVPDRFPGLKIVLVHGGGFLPYQYGRIARGNRIFNGFPDGTAALDVVRWFYYDDVLFEPEPTRYLLDLVGPDRVMAGSDCPFHMADHGDFADPSRLGLDAKETDLVLGGNAGALFSLDGTHG